MKNAGALEISASGEREIVMTRVFDAPRRLVYEAFTRPELLKRWLLGPDSWSMPVCDLDLRVGGKYRYVWRRDRDGKEMGMGGVTTALFEKGGRTTLTQTMLLESREARDAVLASGMEKGVEVSYDRLEAILAQSHSTVQGSR